MATATNANPAADTAVPVDGSRLVTVDALRFICVMWVIWIHVVESPGLQSTIGFVRFRLPVFIILSIFFLFTTQEKRPARTLRRYTMERLRQLYLPFVFWAAFYYAFLGCIDVFIRGAAWPALSRGIWVHGQVVHLWFVPFILAADIVTFPIARALLAISSHTRAILVTSLIAGVGLLAFAGSSFTDSLIDYEYPAHLKDLLWRLVTLGPCIFLGVAAYYTHRHARERWGRMRAPLAVAGLGVCLLCVLLTASARPHPLLDAGAGFGLVLLALYPANHPALSWLARLGKYSFGIYLMHLMFVIAFKLLREYAFRLDPSPWCDVTVFLCSATFSVVSTIALSRCKYTRWLASPIASPRENNDRIPTF